MCNIEPERQLLRTAVLPFSGTQEEIGKGLTAAYVLQVMIFHLGS